MAFYNTHTVMTTTMADYVNLVNCSEVISDMIERMDKDDADILENTGTGEIIEKEDLKKVLNIIDSLLETDKSNRWELI